MQPVRALAAENAQRQVERHVVGLVAFDPEVADADFGLHRIRLVDDDDAAGRIGRRDESGRRHVAALPSRRTPSCTSSNASSAVTSPTTARMALLGTKFLRVKRHQIVARDRRQRLRRAALRACRRGESRRPADRRPRRRRTRDPRSFTCSADSVCCRCRSISSGANAGCRAMSDSSRSPVSKLSFMTTTLTNVRSVPAPAPIDAADEIDRVVHLAGGSRRRPLVEQRRGEIGQPRLVAGIDATPRRGRSSAC